MNGWMDWYDGQMNGWIDGWMNGWIYNGNGWLITWFVFKGERIGRWIDMMDRWMVGWIDEWMDEWTMGRWMKNWIKTCNGYNNYIILIDTQ